MTLAQLTELIEGIELHGDPSVAVDSLTCDSRRAAPGALFFALKGAAADGHRFIGQAEEAGAAAVLLENERFAPAGIPWIKAADGRAAMARVAAAFNGNPTARLPLIGITGTNGKTTTTYLIEAMLTAAGTPAAVLGTIAYRFGDVCIEASHTTPESTELQAALRQLADAGAASFVMEVSSHALEQKRVDGCHFDVGVFSNLTRDHLDYHGDMERYFAAKLRLFRELLRPDGVKPHRRAVVNLDDPSGRAVAAAAACPVVTYGIDHAADVTPHDVSLTVSGISGVLVTPAGEISFSSRLLGRFNLSNILAAAGAGIALGLPPEAIRAGIERHATVPGRLERVENTRGVTCLVDYAHTGDALENVLTTVRQIAAGRIITVFGCGGDRDNGKRPVMGRIAAHYSDLAIVTSDNPRTEDPMAIITQILAGIEPMGLKQLPTEAVTADFTGPCFSVCENRREAIRLASRAARPGDIILLAGKGHEDYQILGTVKYHFDDREEAARALQAAAP